MNDHGSRSGKLHVVGWEEAVCAKAVGFDQHLDLAKGTTAMFLESTPK